MYKRHTSGAQTDRYLVLRRRISRSFRIFSEKLTCTHAHRPELRQNKGRYSFLVNLPTHRLVYVQCCEHHGRLWIQHRQSPSDLPHSETHPSFASQLITVPASASSWSTPPISKSRIPSEYKIRVFITLIRQTWVFSLTLSIRVLVNTS